MLLTYLDRMKPGHAFLGTTNLDLSILTERFQTRFQSVRLQPPGNEALAAFLARRWGAPISITRQVAEGANGNVRAAMADLEMWMGLKAFERADGRPEGERRCCQDLHTGTISTPPHFPDVDGSILPRTRPRRNSIAARAHRSQPAQSQPAKTAMLFSKWPPSRRRIFSPLRHSVLRALRTP